MIDAVIQKLGESVGVTSHVGNRIYSYIRQEQAQTPAVVVELDDETPLNAIQEGAKASVYKFSVYCLSESAPVANALAMATRSALSNWSGPYVTELNSYEIASSYMEGLEIRTELNGRIWVGEVQFSIAITYD
jgi:hypothetical protein